MMSLFRRSPHQGLLSRSFGTLALTTPLTTTLPSLLSRPLAITLPQWLTEAFLLAVPKKKTSHSKKRMRASNKGLKNRTDMKTCPICGSHQLFHHLCLNCYREIKRKVKEQVREVEAH